MAAKLLALALVVCCAPPAAAKRKAPKLPDAWNVLRQSLEPGETSYQGRVLVDVYKGQIATTREMAVRVGAEGKYRREIIGSDGLPAQTIVSDGKTEWIYDRARNKVWEGEPADPYYKRLGPDDEFDLLEENYEAQASTTEPVAGHAAWLVELRSKTGGRVERRLWIDKRKGLVLRSQMYLPDGQLSSEMKFTELQYRKQSAKGPFTFKTPPGAKVVKRLEPDFMALDEAKAAAGLDPKTPEWLPSGYVFESLDVLPRGGRKILHYRFSDGVNVLSLFQCPPHVKLDFGGQDAQQIDMGFGRATTAWTPEGRVLGWTKGGSRFLLVGPLSPEQLARVAGSVR